MIDFPNVYCGGLTEFTIDGGVDVCRHHSRWVLALITPLYERENYFAKYNPIVIKQLVLIYVVYDGTNYNIYIYILMIHNGMTPFQKFMWNILGDIKIIISISWLWLKVLTDITLIIILLDEAVSNAQYI